MGDKKKIKLYQEYIGNGYEIFGPDEDMEFEISKDCCCGNNVSIFIGVDALRYMINIIKTLEEEKKTNGLICPYDKNERPCSMKGV